MMKILKLQADGRNDKDTDEIPELLIIKVLNYNKLIRNTWT